VDLPTITLKESRRSGDIGENAYTCNMLQENCGNDACERRRVSHIVVFAVRFAA
jgi:hypothetical protein